MADELQFTEFEQACFEFLQDPHPVDMVMVRTTRNGQWVSLLCYQDGATLRPLAQMLTEEDLKQFEELQQQ